MKQSVAFVALLSLLVVVNCQSPAERIVNGFEPPLNREVFDLSFPCPPQLFIFMRSSSKPESLSDYTCLTTAFGRILEEPFKTEPCPMVDHWEYMVDPEENFASFAAPCVEICCWLCQLISDCRSWTYRYPTTRCFLNSVAAIPISAPNEASGCIK